MAKAIKKHGFTCLILGLVVIGAMWYLMTLPSQAGDTLAEVDTLSDSRPTTTANHAIYFRTPTGVDASSDTITLDFDNTFVLGNTTATDIDFATTTAVSDCPNATYGEAPLAYAAAAGTWGVTTTAATMLMTFTPPTNNVNRNINTNTCIRIKIGTNATGGANQITNGWPGVKDIDIAGAFGDTGKMKVAIIEGVVVTATISETLNVTVNASTCVDFIVGSNTRIASATTSISYGTVSNLDNFYDSCQRLDIGTNAASGYVATLYKTQRLTADGNIIPDGNFAWPTPGCDNGCSSTTEAVWQVPDNNGFGYCMKDRDYNGAQVADSGWATNPCNSAVASQYFKLIANNSTDAQNIMRSGSATSTNRAWIGYRLSVDSAQAAGVYTTTLVYIVTPTY